MGTVESLRLFLPNLYLVLGYWIPALLITADRLSPDPSWFEQWLSRSDERCRSACPALPAILLLPAETAYLACYPIVPVSMVTNVAGTTRQATCCGPPSPKVPRASPTCW